MKQEHVADSDPMLSRALREWVVSDSLPPRFRERVWHRIALQDQSPSADLWAQAWGWLARRLTRPALAVSYVTLLVLAGLLAGYWHARLDTARMSGALGARYVQMLDPYQARH